MKNKNISIVLSILVLAGLGFFYYKSQNPSINSVLDSQIEINKDNKDSIDTTFTNAPNDKLILKQEVNLTPENKAFFEKRIKEYEAKLVAFDDKTSLVDKVGIYFMLSSDYRGIGEYGKAKELLEAAMALDPKNSNMMQVYSSLLAVMGDKASALIYINKAIALHGIESNYWLWKIDLEKERGVVGDKLAGLYKSALDATAGDLNIVTVYAKFLEGEKKYDEAITQWTKAIELYPDNKSTYQAEIDRLKTLVN